MELGAILFSLAMVLLVAAYVLRPIARNSQSGNRATNYQLFRLQAERDRVLTSIQDLDMDHSMGKVPEEHYQEQRKALAMGGADILRQIDELQLGENGAEAEPQLSEREMQLEAAVAEAREKSLSSQPRAVASKTSRGFCTTCGEPVFQGDRFCANCGAAVEEQVA